MNDYNYDNIWVRLNVFSQSHIFYDCISTPITVNIP